VPVVEIHHQWLKSTNSVRGGEVEVT